MRYFPLSGAVLLACFLLGDHSLAADSVSATKPAAAVAGSGNADLVDAERLARADVVLRGTCTRNPAGPGKGGYPTYKLVITHAFKPADDAKYKVGSTVTIISILNVPETEATYYLKPWPAYGPGYYRPIDENVDHPDRSISHVATAPATRPAVSALVDEAMMAKVPVVLRVKWKEISPPGGNPSDTVEVLQVIKNTSDQKWGKEARIDHEPGKDGVPRDQECTVYLEISQTLRGWPWALLGGGAKTGVSHIGGAATTQPAVK